MTQSSHSWECSEAPLTCSPAAGRTGAYLPGSDSFHRAAYVYCCHCMVCTCGSILDIAYTGVLACVEIFSTVRHQKVQAGVCHALNANKIILRITRNRFKSTWLILDKYACTGCNAHSTHLVKCQVVHQIAACLIVHICIQTLPMWMIFRRQRAPVPRVTLSRNSHEMPLANRAKHKHQYVGHRTTELRHSMLLHTIKAACSKRLQSPLHISGHMR